MPMSGRLRRASERNDEGVAGMRMLELRVGNSGRLRLAERSGSEQGLFIAVQSMTE